MAPREKYTEFIVCDPEIRRGKLAPYDETSYITIICPYCKGEGPEGNPEVKAEHIKFKASVIKRHIQNCDACETAYPELHGRPAKKSKIELKLDEVITKLNKAEEERSRAEERIVSTIRAVGEAANLGPPPPTSQEELCRRLREKEAGDRLDATRSTLFYEQQTCVICFEMDADRLLVPCNHRVTCTACWRRHAGMATRDGYAPKCPTCNVLVSNTLRISSD